MAGDLLSVLEPGSDLSALQSATKAKAALVSMELALVDARTYEEIRAIETWAEILKRLYGEVEEVRQQAERTIVLASHRVGIELTAQPLAKAGRPTNRPSESADLPTPTLAQQVGSKNRGLRLKRLAAVDRDAVALTVRALHGAGKEATVAAVLKTLHGDDKKTRRTAREGELAAATIAASTLLKRNVYGVILADPPWRFEPYSRETGMDRAAENHYPTMDVAAIEAMRVPAANDCVLFLWATSPMLLHAIAVMAAWGFAYKSQVVWAKDKIGPGYWFREQHELLLVGTRGNVPAPAPGEQYSSLQPAPRGRHSEKPFLFHEIIDAYFPTVPKLEMFARGGTPLVGWTRWGNEAVAAE